ncbi:MAG: LysM peptidoglycan-binding domain-containing protein [Burkholderiaceae bacterium]|nr:MAG: LysM peptidoglycan-binding domain-containing protein [Burkholderiaceae bacterium]
MSLNVRTYQCSRAVFVLGACLLIATAFSAQAQSRYPITPEQRSTAEKVASAGVPLSELAPNAPDSYTIVKGDTLWGISSLFLKSPWRWPELWGMNKNEIKNPHLIYPGQVLYLERIGDRARLRMGAAPGPSSEAVKLTPCMSQAVGSGDDAIKVKPCVRGESLAAKPIPPIPNNVIEPFLSQPLIVEAHALDTAPRVMATQEGRVYVGTGDTAYVRGIQDQDATDYYVYRPAKPLKHPDTQKILAYEAAYLGIARQVQPGDPATFKIVNGKEEIGVGDQLVKVERPNLTDFIPHAPDEDLTARVLSIYGGVAQAGTYEVVAISAGREQGLEIGHVLALYRTGEKVKDHTDRDRLVKLPNEQYGYLFIFRTFEKVAYGLVMNVHLPVVVGDTVQKP